MTTRLRTEPGWQPSPQKPTIYNGPDVPTAYDTDWQYFTNLTQDQIAWFQAQPEWSDFVATQPAVSFPTIISTVLK